MTEKRVLIAAALSIAFMAAYGQWLTHKYPSAKGPRQTATPASTTPTVTALTVEQPLEHESVTLIQGPGVELEIGEQTAAIRRVILQDFLDNAKQSRARFGGEVPVFHFTGPVPIEWSVAERSDNRIVMRGQADGKDYYISYTCCDPKYVVNIELSGDLSNKASVSSGWSRADEMSGNQNVLEAVAVTRETPDAKINYRKLGPSRAPKNVPRGTYQLSLAERYFCQSLKFPAAVQTTVQEGPGQTIRAVSTFGPNQTSVSAQLYVGPRDFFYLRAAGFTEAFKIGVLGQIGLILLMIITWLAHVTKSYGAAIILFAAGITSLMAPFTLMGYRSMRKMQELKPKMDAIMAKHKGDSQKANREVFALYKEHKVSPMSGCLPMLLQLPIFIALFQALTHFIALRGQEFLWIKDLSMPDRLAMLPFSIPLLGNELNLLPLIMAGAMFLQNKLTQANMGAAAADNPTAKIMSGPLMSVIFGMMFYHFPSGLVLYWLFNSLTSMAWYRLSK